MLRVIQYNIHRFLGSDGAATLQNITSALKPLSPDILTLNEMDITTSPTAFETLSKSLGLPHVEFYGHVKERYGNAILSKYPLKRIESTPLPGGTELVFPEGTKKLNGDVSKANEKHRIVRGFLVVELEYPGVGNILVGCTHLDHISIQERKIQLEYIQKSFEKNNNINNNNPIILCGDMNALQREDYSKKQWTCLEQRASNNAWNLPQFGDLDILTSNGFVDTNIKNESADATYFTAPTTEKDPLYRIDYVFTKDSDRIALSCIKSKPATAITFSDHFPLVVDLQLEKLKQSAL